MKKETNGITLIALVITIIVLLILAGVTIASLSGDNGILKRAAEAKEQTKKADAEEQIKLGLTEVIMKNKLGDDIFKNLLDNKFGAENVTSNPDGSFTITKDGYQVKVDSKGTIINEGQSPDSGGGNQEPVSGGPNAPVIPTGMTVKYLSWDESGVEKDDNTGLVFDYSAGKWANIKTIANGQEAYWVWIPRFEYKIPTEKPIDVNNPPMIDVKFISSTKTTATPGYTIHPAFTFGNDGNKDLPGIWVAKFEASSSNPNAVYGGSDTNTLKVNVKPNVTSWRGISVANIFTVCQNMQKGGVLGGTGTQSNEINKNVDGHMMKNTEWGAVAILGQSQYGIYNNNDDTQKNVAGTAKQVWNNPNTSFITGKVGNFADDKSQPTVEGQYGYNDILKNGPNASTTGTVYGVYDMAGGAWEYVAGCWEGYQVGKENANYFDIYNSSNSTSGIPGDATRETQGWNGDCANFVYSSYPVFVRGGVYDNGAGAGVFYFDYNNGSANSYNSFRPVFVCVPSL